MTDRIINHLQKGHPAINVGKIRTIIGLLYMAILIIGAQLSVEGTGNGWVFVNFQIFAVVFISYFLQLEIKFWQMAIVIVAFMGINGTLMIPLSWLFAGIYVGLYFAMKMVKQHQHRAWNNFVAYSLVNLVFSAAMWTIMKFRFDLHPITVGWELLFSFFFMTITFVYIDSVRAGANTLAQLTYTTNFDELTHVHNFYAYKNDFSQAFEHAQRHQNPLTLMLFDIDHFKQVNDAYGHLTGDHVLATVSQMIMQELAVNDVKLQLYRTGGEEFTIIFANYTSTQAHTIVDAIARRIRETPMQDTDATFDITISAGLTQLQSTDENQVDVYRRADEQLYYAKRHGRDQISVG
ncbi:diguanylate cyclase [Levilactobacillus sp. N40-8-2]|uniref:diguanylate cyclase n=1 Tax=Levilactobacillus muriae TaxID=3238987 RepID=UPI0038B37193